MADLYGRELAEECGMGWFRSTRLPMTTYGYTPPPEATANGWRCWTDGCHRAEEGAPRRWPVRCPGCGNHADPVFDEPWAHDAKRFEIDFVLANPAESVAFKQLYRVESEVWNYTDALRRNDLTKADGARAALRAVSAELVSADRYFVAGAGFMRVVLIGLRSGDVDGVADELLAWYPTVNTDGVNEDNARRTTSRQFAASCLEFLGHPAGARHAAAGQVRAQLLDVARRARDVLTMDIEAGLARVFGRWPA